METTPTRELTRTTLAVLFLVGMLATSFWILQPFLGPLIWATLLVIASWPLLRRVQAWFGDRRGPAVAVMLGVLLLVFFIPVTLILGVLIAYAPAAAEWARHVVEEGLPAPPAWVADLPLVGARLATSWTELAAAGPEGLAARIAPYAEAVAGWLVGQAGGFGLLVVHFLLTLAIAGVLFARGETFAANVRLFARRLAGDRGERVAVLAAQSVRAVAFGVVVTALVQAAAGGVGLFIAGVPLAGLLTAVMFVTSIAQVGAAPVLGLAGVWLFVQNDTGWGIAMIVWMIVVGSLDNVVRPLLIRKGVDLPLMLVFAGVIGGLLALGPIGLFIGPVVLAISHTLLMAWIHEEPGGQTMPLPSS